MLQVEQDGVDVLRLGLLDPAGHVLLFFDGGRVHIEGDARAAGHLLKGGLIFLAMAVKVGDRVQVQYARKVVLVEVTEIPGKQMRKGEGYRVLDEQVVEEDLFGD